MVEGPVAQVHIRSATCSPSGLLVKVTVADALVSILCNEWRRQVLIYCSPSKTLWILNGLNIFLPCTFLSTCRGNVEISIPAIHAQFFTIENVKVTIIPFILTWNVVGHHEWGSGMDRNSNCWKSTGAKSSDTSSFACYLNALYYIAWSVRLQVLVWRVQFELKTWNSFSDFQTLGCDHK